MPPTTENPAAAAVSLAFASRFRMFVSPHILRNIARAMRAVGHTEATVEGFVTGVAEICEFSGGAVIEPQPGDNGVPDHEDNPIAALVKDPAVDALILVTSVHHLLDLGPNWNGRLVMRPHDFVRRVVAR